MSKSIVKIIRKSTLYKWLASRPWISAFFCRTLKEKHSSMADRTWAKEFVDYTEFIVIHLNYKGLFYERKKDGGINWVVAGNSRNGNIRRDWWDVKCKELGIPIRKGCYAIAAVAIHPTKKHVCQICGRTMSIYYEYPTIHTIAKLNEALDVDLEHFDLTIGEIIDKFCETQADLSALNNLFEARCASKEELKKYVYEELVRKRSGRFSPGVMSNPPDRFDGFHSDGACCREISDKGRHKMNMRTYTQDRRAYEHWADGDFNAANRLMGEFQKFEDCECPACGRKTSITADHIGPISLGFSHRPKFNPLCGSCNSAKNNRCTFNDIKQLIDDEKNGANVVSWHSKYIWDLLKGQVTNDKQAQLLSYIMLTCHQNVLKLFSVIYYNTGKEFLIRYLNPDYALYDIRFNNFDPSDLSKLEIVKTPLNSKNKESNKNRYLRVAFEALRDFDLKDNRKTKFYISEIDEEISNIVTLIKDNEGKEANALLLKTINKLSDVIYNDLWIK